MGVIYVHTKQTTYFFLFFKHNHGYVPFVPISQSVRDNYRSETLLLPKYNIIHTTFCGHSQTPSMIFRGGNLLDNVCWRWYFYLFIFFFLNLFYAAAELPVNNSHVLCTIAEAKTIFFFSNLFRIPSRRCAFKRLIN